MFSPRQIGGVLVALVTTNAIAAEDAPPTNNASIYAGGEWGDTESQRLDAGAVFRYHTATIFSAAVSRGEADLTVGRASSTYATARVTHDFGSFGLGAGVRHGEVEDVSNTLGWPPLRGPLFITTTFGWMARTNCGEFDRSSPWCVVW